LPSAIASLGELAYHSIVRMTNGNDGATDGPPDVISRGKRGAPLKGNGSLTI